MLANEGYIPLSYLSEAAYSRGIDDAAEYMNDWAEHVYKFILLRTEDVVQRWLRGFCTGHLFLTDGLNPPIRVDDWKIWHKWPIDIVASELRGEAGLDFAYPKELKDDFRLCDPVTKVELEKFGQDDNHDPVSEEWLIWKANMIDNLGQTLPNLFLESNFFSVDLRLFHFVRSKLDDDSKFDRDIIQTAERLKPVEGMFLCVPKRHVDENWDNHWSNILERTRRSDADGIFDQETSFGVGRPRKQEALVNSYNRLFPEGRGGMTWKEVIKAIEEDTGLTASVDTLRRGLAAKG